MTAQVHEKLIFEGEETSMAFCPPLPDHHPRIIEGAGFFRNLREIKSSYRQMALYLPKSPQKKGILWTPLLRGFRGLLLLLLALLSSLQISEDSHPLVSSTACWRRYIGIWEIKNGLFYLVGIIGRYKMLGDEPILADWFDGVLRIPKGECLHYVHMGFGSVYEEEIHVKIENGVVVKSRLIDNRNKAVNRSQLGWQNLPGSENRFEGDDEMWE